jgi:hypothetical protein
VVRQKAGPGDSLYRYAGEGQLSLLVNLHCELFHRAPLAAGATVNRPPPDARRRNREPADEHTFATGGTYERKLTWESET